MAKPKPVMTIYVEKAPWGDYVLSYDEAVWKKGEQHALGEPKEIKELDGKTHNDGKAIREAERLAKINAKSGDYDYVVVHFDGREVGTFTFSGGKFRRSTPFPRTPRAPKTMLLGPSPGTRDTFGEGFKIGVLGARKPGRAMGTFGRYSKKKVDAIYKAMHGVLARLGTPAGKFLDEDDIFTFETRAGKLTAHLRKSEQGGVWFYSRFENPEAAARIAPGGVNPYSGKWNHFFDDKPEVSANDLNIMLARVGVEQKTAGRAGGSKASKPTNAADYRKAVVAELRALGHDRAVAEKLVKDSLKSIGKSRSVGVSAKVTAKNLHNSLPSHVTKRAAENLRLFGRAGGVKTFQQGYGQEFPQRVREALYKQYPSGSYTAQWSSDYTKLADIAGIKLRSSSTLPKAFQGEFTAPNGIRIKVVAATGAYAKHRVFVWCDKCGEWVPVGRVAQHSGGKKHLGL